MRKLAVVFVLLSSAAFGQNAQASWDTGLWFAAGHSVAGGTSGVSLIAAGFRLGKVLTEDHGPGVLRGNFEYAIDLVPLYLVHQGIVLTPSNTVYGGGFNPINLKWNFTSAKRATPYLELGGGTLFSTQDVPAGTNSVNFRTHAGFGVHVRPITFEIRYEHISNAGLASPNPGINSVQGMVGWNSFSSCKWLHKCHPI